MKNLRYILLGLLLLIASGAFAQIKFGVKGGLNVSNFHVKDNDNIERTNLSPGISAGAFARVPIVKQIFSVQPEIMFSQKGAKYDTKETTIGMGKVALKTSYIDVPLLGMIHIGKRFNLFAGPQASFLVAATQKTNGSVLGIADGTKSVRNRFKDIDFGGVAGIGAEYGALIFNARYNLGLSKVYNAEGSEVNTFGYTNARNQVVQLQIGIMF